MSRKDYRLLLTHFSLPHLCVDIKIHPHKSTAENYHNQVTAKQGATLFNSLIVLSTN